MFLHPTIQLEVIRQRHQDLTAARRRGGVSNLTAADHFGHRESDDIVVDLFWNRRVGDEFRVEVEDRREHVRFVLRPKTGEEAIQAFYHPFAVASWNRSLDQDLANGYLRDNG